MPEPTRDEISLLLKFDGLADGDQLVYDSSKWADHRLCTTGLSIRAAGGLGGSGSLAATQRAPAGIIYTGTRFAVLSGQSVTIEGSLFPLSRVNATAAPPIFNLRDLNTARSLVELSLYGTGNQVSCRFNGDVNSFTQHGYTPEIGGRLHWVVAIVDGQARLYLNGVLAKSGLCGTTNSTGEFRFGTWVTVTPDPLDVRFDEVRFSRIDVYPDGVPELPGPFPDGTERGSVPWPGGSPQ